MQLPTIEELEKAMDSIAARGVDSPQLRPLIRVCREFGPLASSIQRGLEGLVMARSADEIDGALTFLLMNGLQFGLEIADQRVKKAEEEAKRRQPYVPGSCM